MVFEQMPQRNEGERVEGPAFFEIGAIDNKVQIALMKRFGELSESEQSDAALEWVSRFADNFGRYAKENPGEEVDINDTKSLDRLLGELGALPEGDETLH